MSTTDFQPTIPMEHRRSSIATSDSAGTKKSSLEFHGNGAEYFKIWIVNLVLSIISLGIYSAWAKVRTQRYLHANTELAGSRFEYHGLPRSILIGRALMAGLVFAAIILIKLGNPKALILLPIAVLLFPWLIANSIRFRAAMVSWRGVRFSWHGSTGKVYLLALKVILLTVITFGIYYFAAHHRLKRLLIDDSYFGDARFEGSSKAGEFFGPYWIFGVVTTISSKLIEYTGHSMVHILGENFTAVAAGAVSAFVFYVYYKVFSALLSKIVQNKTRLDILEFENTMVVGELAKLYAGNCIRIALTLGLYWPWARIRELKYLCSHFEVIGNIEELHATNAGLHAPAAFGQEAAGFFDFDISF